MKKTVRLFTSLLLCALLLSALSAAAFASGSIDYAAHGRVTVTAADTTFNSTDLFGSDFKELMPGDSVTGDVTIKNSSTETDYVRISLHAFPNDETTAEAATLSAAKELGKDAADMLDFLDQLDITVTNANTGAVVYSGKAGGEYGPNGAFIALGDYKSGESLTLRVVLSVPLTLGNEYASRVGEIDWQILVEAFDNSQITVIKRWSKDNAADHSTDAVTVNLLCDGQIAQTVELSAKNNWTYTFEKRVGESAIRPDYAEHEWTVEEAPVPEGYTAHYTVTDDGSTVYIDNVGTGGDTPITYSDITVKKVWNDKGAKSRPGYVLVGAYDEHGVLQKRVMLSDRNSWTDVFKDVPSNWSIKEYNIPYGYTPYYSRVGNVITITNSTSLIQTGQLNWPVAVLGGLGVLLIALGLITSAKRRKASRA